MVRIEMKCILMVVLGLSLTLWQAGSAQAGLTEKQRLLMKEGSVNDLAGSLVKGSKGRIEKVSRIYSFVRDEIEIFEFKEQRSPSRVLRDGAGREEDKARLLSRLLGTVKVKGYLAIINFVKYGEDQTYAFVALKVTGKEAEAMSKATGGQGKFTWFPIQRKKGGFVPLVPVPGYFIGQLSTDFYQEVEEGSGKWKKWKYNVNFVEF